MTAAVADICEEADGFVDLDIPLTQTPSSFLTLERGVPLSRRDDRERRLSASAGEEGLGIRGKGSRTVLVRLAILRLVRSRELVSSFQTFTCQFKTFSDHLGFIG